MCDSLVRRFAGCFHYDHSRWTDIYAATAYLDLRFRHGLPQELQDTAKEFIITECPISTYTYSTDVHEIPVLIDEEMTADEDLSLAIDCTASSLLSTFGRLADRSNEAMSADVRSNHQINAEFEIYERFEWKKDVEASPIEFWNSTTAREQMPLLSKVALDMVSIPASSVSVEQLFSFSRRAKSDVRLRLGAKALENECLIRLNQYLLSC
jgi:hypothetical protein